MSKEDFKIIICDLPHREELVAEVYYKSISWVEISAEIPNQFVVNFGNCNKGNKGKYWKFPYDEAMEVLQKAKSLLAEKQRTPEQQAEHDAWIEKHKNWNPTPEETAEYERKMAELRKKYYG